MPFAAPNKLDEENDLNKQGQAGQNVSGESTTFSTGVPGQEASGKSQKNSGQYTNIQSYLDANKQQANAMGAKIGDQVDAKVTDATQRVTSFESQAPKVEAYDPNNVINNATTASAADKAQYKTMKQTGGYTGPQNINEAQGYGETTKAVQSAAEDLKNAGSDTGQQQLLRQTFGRPQYSAGENKLDQVLLRGSPESKTRLQGLSQKYSGLNQALDSATQKVGAGINQATTQALANRNAFAPAETSARQALIAPIQQRADQANANNGSYIDRVVADASDDTLSDETLAALGLSEGQNIYDMNLSNYITQDRSQIGLNNAATADERARYSALMSLFDDPTMTQITADGKTVSPVKFNKEQFDKDFSGKDAEYKNAYSNYRGLYEAGPGGWEAASGATPEQLEKSVIPELERLNALYPHPHYSYPLNQLKTALANWKAKYQPTRTVKKG